MKPVRTPLLAGLVAMGFSFELTFYTTTQCLGDTSAGPDESVYRVYDLANSDAGITDAGCQVLKGSINDQFTCTEFTQGGSIGPMNCGTGLLQTWSVAQDTEGYNCKYYADLECSSELSESESTGDDQNVESCVGPWGSGGSFAQSFKCSSD